MALDKKKTAFSSQWEIDNLLDPIPDKAVSANINTLLYALNDPNWWNMFHVQFSPDGINWYNVGIYDHGGVVHNTHAWYDSGGVYFVSDIPGTARIWVWADKVNY